MHGIRWMDIQRPQLPEPCVVDKALHTRQLRFFKGRVNLEGPQVCGREHIAHLRFVRLYNPFFILMKFTTTHLQFVKSTTHFLARTTINNFNQPFKTEFNKISHILMGFEIFLSRNF